MSSDPVSERTPYRVTFFFGPDHVADKPSDLVCVFNVKKRSWKGGIQVGIELSGEQLGDIRRMIGFDEWLTRTLAEMSDREREDYRLRAQDLFVQATCALKLDLVLQSGLTQENQTISSAVFISEVNHTSRAEPHRITDHVLIELDLAAP
ncbi:MAG: hypothetical protein ACT4OO_09470 [Nitrospiraceae bacterium]